MLPAGAVSVCTQSTGLPPLLTDVFIAVAWLCRYYKFTVHCHFRSKTDTAGNFWGVTSRVSFWRLNTWRCKFQKHPLTPGDTWHNCHEGGVVTPLWRAGDPSSVIFWSPKFLSRGTSHCINPADNLLSAWMAGSQQTLSAADLSIYSQWSWTFLCLTVLCGQNTLTSLGLQC